MRKNNDDSFYQYIRGFLTIFLPRNKCYGYNTVKSYRDTLNLFRTFLLEKKSIPFTGITFDLINHTLVNEFMVWLQEERHCSANTRNQRLAGFKSFLRYCSMENASLTAVYMNIKKISAQKKASKVGVDYMTRKALKAMLDQPDPHTRCGARNRFFMILLYDTAARIQEMLDLKLKDILLEVDTPSVYLTGKGNKTRAIPLMDKTILHLKEYLNTFHRDYPDGKEEYLFYTVIKGKRGPMSPDNVSCFLKKIAISAKLKCPEVPDNIHAHLFRHSRSMHLYQAGIPLSYIKDFLGHASINTTSIYASADIAMMKAALEKAVPNKKETKEDPPIWKGNEDLILKLCGLK
jgi:integrase/recombinase XerD